MKVCKTCKRELDESYFNLNSKEKGLRADCKQCFKEKYCLTPKGRAIKAWRGICDRAENNSGERPTYKNVKNLMTKDEFLSWAIPAFEEAIRIYPNSKLTIDRINEGNYELNNIQILTMSDNVKKRKTINSYAPANTKWCRRCKCYKPQDQFYPKEYRCIECCSKRHELYRRNKGVEKRNIKLNQEKADAIRKLNHLSRKALSKMYGVSESAIQKIRSGKLYPPNTI